MTAPFVVHRDDPCTTEIKPPAVLRKLGITLDALDRKTFPELREIVPGILPEGLTILGGRIKLGKSWLMYDVSTAVAYGGLNHAVIDKEGEVVVRPVIMSPDRMRRSSSSEWGRSSAGRIFSKGGPMPSTSALV